jgi:hypothetical protein
MKTESLIPEAWAFPNAGAITPKDRARRAGITPWLQRARAAPKLLRMSVPTERPLDEEEREENHALCSEGIELIELPEDRSKPNWIVREIRAYVDVVRSLEEPPADLEQQAYALGSLYGEELCSIGWQWVRLTYPGQSQSHYAVVSPNRANVLFPHHYLFRLLTERGSDNTVALSFNMIAAGSTPGAPGSYTKLG